MLELLTRFVCLVFLKKGIKRKVVVYNFLLLFQGYCIFFISTWKLAELNGVQFIERHYISYVIQIEQKYGRIDRRIKYLVELFVVLEPKR